MTNAGISMKNNSTNYHSQISSIFINQNNNNSSCDVVDWELRPGGMLVQRRDPSSARPPDLGPPPSPLLTVKVSFGQRRHEVDISSQATFGELKRALAPLTGLPPQEQRLLFEGKERDDTDYLHIAGVDGKSKIILVEDPASKERKLEEIKRNSDIARACQAVAHVRDEVDNLAEQVLSLEAAVGGGTKVAESKFSMLVELLMRQLLRLDSIEAEGEAKVQRKVEVRRVQGLADVVDRLKLQNSNSLLSNTAVVATKWQTFDTGVGSLSAPPPSASSTRTTDWTLFD